MYIDKNSLNLYNTKMRLNQKGNPRTKRAFAHAAISKAKADKRPESIRKAFELSRSSSLSKKGRGLPGNAQGALGELLVIGSFKGSEGSMGQLALKGEEYEESGGIFNSARSNRLSFMVQAALNTPGVDIIVWPLGSPSDYERYFQEEEKVRGPENIKEIHSETRTGLAIPMPEPTATRITRLGEYHHGIGNIPCEVIYDRDVYPTEGLSPFWNEVERLEQGTGHQVAQAA